MDKVKKRSLLPKICNSAEEGAGKENIKGSMNVKISPRKSQKLLPLLQSNKYEMVQLNAVREIPPDLEYFHSIPLRYKDRPEIVHTFRHLMEEFKVAQAYFTLLRLTQLNNIAKRFQAAKITLLHHEKILILFDIDETLINAHTTKLNADDVEIRLPGSIGGSKYPNMYISIRPYVREMLTRLVDSGKFELGTFTASNKLYATEVLRILDPTMQIFKHRLYRQHCSRLAADVYCKDLRRLSGIDVYRTLLVDNSPYSFVNGSQHAIPILPFTGDQADRQLESLTKYLLELSNVSPTQENREFFVNRVAFPIDNY